MVVMLMRYLMVGLLAIAPAAAVQVTVSAGTQIVPLQEICMLVHKAIMENSPLYAEQETLRGKNNTALILLSGLAQTCYAAGKAAGAQTQAEQKEGILNTVGSVFATAAALVADQQQRENNNQSPTRLVKSLAHEATLLACQLDNTPGTRLPDKEMFAMLRKFDSAAERESFVQLLLNNATMAQEFLQDLWASAYSYLNEHASAFNDAVDTIITNALTTWLTQQEAATTAAPQDPQRNTMMLFAPGNCVMFRPSQDPAIHVQTIEHIVNLVKRQLFNTYSTFFIGDAAE